MLVYIASPYSHPDPAVRQQRFEAACKAAAWQMQYTDDAVFSPIAHSHPIEQHFDGIEGLEFWLKQDIAILRHADRLLVLRLPGWEQSKGVAREIEIARSIGIHIEYIDP